MKDPTDPGTAELDLARRRRGRPPKYASGPMSGAERARRYRQGVRLEARQVVPTIVLEADGEPLRDSAMLEALRVALAAGDARAVREVAGEFVRRYS